MTTCPCGREWSLDTVQDRKAWLRHMKRSHRFAVVTNATRLIKEQRRR